jgi:hypothetical protein
MICRNVRQGRALSPDSALRQISWFTGASGVQNRTNLLKTDDKAPRAMKNLKILIENMHKVFGLWFTVSEVDKRWTGGGGPMASGYEVVV